MHRRTFLRNTSATLAALAASRGYGEESANPACCDRTYATVEDALRAPAESLLYVTCIQRSKEVAAPDYLATIDTHPASPSHGKVVHRLEMPHVGDELHHFGWTACSSCHGQAGRERRFMVIPGLASSRIHIVDTLDPVKPKLHHVIDGEEVKSKANLSAPHTVHCLADGMIMISMLGDAVGEGPGGFLLLDDKFRIAGRWERNADGMRYNYDYWYQPRLNVMVSSEWGAPNTVSKGFKVEDVQAGKYGQRIHVWNWKERKLTQSIDLGDTGRIPLEVRFHHRPDSPHGFVGAALSSTMFHFHQDGAQWRADQVIAVEPVETKGWPFPVPGLITDLVLSLDDRWLYFSNWLHGDLRQYDVSDPAHPKLTGQLWLGGVIGKTTDPAAGEFGGGPQMLQLSLDGKRLYVSNSLFSPWDDQFYPGMKERGSQLLRVDCDTTSGGMKIDPGFRIDFGAEPHGPARAHEMRFPGGDCTSDIWS